MMYTAQMRVCMTFQYACSFVTFSFCRLNISDYIQSKQHIQLAHDMATQTMVLLKNEQFESTGLPILSPYDKACVSQGNYGLYLENIYLYTHDR